MWYFSHQALKEFLLASLAVLVTDLPLPSLAMMESEEFSLSKSASQSTEIKAQSSIEEKQGSDEVWILSIDGGGTRGLIPATILERLETSLQEEFKIDVRIADFFQLCAGTSTGAIIALGLTVPSKFNKYRPRYLAKDLAHLYETKAEEIFPPSRWGKARSLVKDKYEVKAYEDILKEYFQDTQIHEATNDIDLLVPAYNLTKSEPFFFHGGQIKANINHHESTFSYMMRDVARASSAAPTYFKAASIRGEEFIDGGVFMNDPALEAYIRAKKSFPGKKKFIVVSLGTGQVNSERSLSSLRSSGVIEWGIHIPDLMMNGAMALVHRQLKELSGEALEYYRIQAVLEEESDLDNVSAHAIENLTKAAHKVIKDNAEFLAVYQKLRLFCQHKINSINSTFSSLETATEFNVAELLLRDSDWKTLSQAILNHPFITVLNLRRTALGEEALKSLCRALRSNKVLATLDLSENGIGENISFLGPLLDANTTIKILNLRCNGINISDAISSIKGLLAKKNGSPTSLTSLDLSENGIGAKGILAANEFKIIAEALTSGGKSSPLCYLYLDKSQIKTGFLATDEGTEEWMRVFIKLGNELPLTHFYFTDNPIDEKIDKIISKSSYKLQFTFKKT